MSESAHPPTRSGPDLAEQLWELWRRGQRPDVRAFLGRAGELSPAQLVAVLRVDQQERWKAGERVPAETYLSAHPELEADPEKAFELIYREFLLREDRGERPALEEFVARFPRYAERLRQQVEWHEAVGEHLDSGGVSTASGAVPTPGTVADGLFPAGPASERPDVPG